MHLALHYDKDGLEFETQTLMFDWLCHASLSEWLYPACVHGKVIWRPTETCGTGYAGLLLLQEKQQ